MIVYTHIIEIFILAYIAYCLKNDQIIEKEVKSHFYLAGLFLGGVLVGNQIWYLIARLAPTGDLRDGILRVTASICYALIPPVVTLLLWINQKKASREMRVFVHLIGPLFVLVPLINIFHPILFVVQDARLTFLPGKYVYAACEAVYFTWLLYRYYVHSFAQFPKDNVLLSMVVIVVVLGQMAENHQMDYTTSWGSFAIAYYFLYRAVANLYENTDQLTRVANYYSYVNQLRSIEKKKVTLVAFDLNGLKTYNDTQGHQKGDEYLIAFAQTVQKKLRGKGMLYRNGGDEFVLLSPLSADELTPILESLKEQKCNPKYGDFLLSFSYGIIEKLPEETSEEAIARADKKMYDMKMEYYRTHDRRVR